MRKTLHLCLALGVLTGVACGDATSPARTVEEFGAQLDDLRRGARIAGLSAAIVADGRIVWTLGLGHADLERNVRVADSTAFHLASLTKPFASVILLQLVDEGRLTLSSPVSDFGIQLASPGTIQVRHLLSHISSGQPGSTFAYDGNRFGLLDSVIARTLGQTFAQAVQSRIVQPAALTHTAPNPLSLVDVPASGRTSGQVDANLARGYRYASFANRLTIYPSYFGTASGLTASVLDVARFSIALDEHVLLKPELLDLAFTAVVTTSGQTTPYGLGWFVTKYQGHEVIWHYGLWTAISSLIVKVPAKGLTFVLLANGEGLSAAYPLGAGRLDTSPWARAFLDAFVLGTATLP
jgi:CubicO group peptidase (beta-lactamase class C family)